MVIAMVRFYGGLVITNDSLATSKICMIIIMMMKFIEPKLNSSLLFNLRLYVHRVSIGVFCSGVLTNLLTVALGEYSVYKYVGSRI